jgi:hypothetical protein
LRDKQQEIIELLNDIKRELKIANISLQRILDNQ